MYQEIGQNNDMGKWGYMAMLCFTICGSFWLEIVLKVGVLRRMRRVLFSIVPVASAFLVWDGFAIHSGHWSFDKRQILGIFGPAGIPLEEFLFFIVVPIASIMTIEAVRVVKKSWPVTKQ
jgi:lycopene cyclase domain-containing protein